MKFVNTSRACEYGECCFRCMKNWENFGSTNLLSQLSEVAFALKATDFDVEVTIIILNEKTKTHKSLHAN